MTATITDVELDTTGRIDLGAVSPETAERLELLDGEWLEYSPEERALVVCHVQPGGAPTLAALPAELIALLDALAPEEREAVPGGALVVRDRSGIVLRLVVARGEIQVQWPHEDWSRAEPVPLDPALSAVDPASARVSGSVRLATRPGAEDSLVELVAHFDGLYPEGNLMVERENGTLRAELRDVNVGPEQLLATLKRLADPPESLEAELEVGSFLPHALDGDFRLTVRAGRAQAARPALWPEG
jgi:hypothetical protein